MAILQFRQLAFVPPGDQAVIPGNPGQALHSFSTAAGAGLMDPPDRYPAVGTGREIGGKDNPGTFRFKKDLSDEGGQCFL